MCLKEVYQRVEKERIFFFLKENHIFRYFDKDIFLKKYYCFFVWEYIPRNEFILRENKDSTDVFFIKNGEYEITLNKSLHEINELLKEYTGKGCEEAEGKMDLLESELHRLMKKKNHIKVIFVFTCS
jgi:hypothetical protein